MATKPTLTPRWGDGVAAIKIAPTSGKQDIGYIEGEQPVPGTLTWLLHLIYTWILWLYDGDCYFNGDVTADTLGTVEADVRHGNATHAISVIAFMQSAGTKTTEEVTHASGFTVTVDITPTLKVGDTVKSVRIRLNDNGGAGWSAPTLYKRDMATRVQSTVAGASSGGGGGDAWWTYTPTAPGEVVTTGFHYYLVAISGVDGGSAYGAESVVAR